MRIILNMCGSQRKSDYVSHRGSQRFDPREGGGLTNFTGSQLGPSWRLAQLTIRYLAFANVVLQSYFTTVSQNADLVLSQDDGI